MQGRFTRWLATRLADAREDDRGSVLGEYGVLLGLMAVGAAGAAAYILANVTNWLEGLPTP